MDKFFNTFMRIPLIFKILGVVVVYLISFVVFYFLFLIPEQEEQEALKKQISQLEFDLEEKKKLVGDLAEYKREVEKLDQDLQRALKLLPDRAEIPSLLQKISSLAKKSNLEILSFTPLKENRQNFYAKVPVDLRLSGSFMEVTHFFDAIGKLSRIVNIDNYAMSIIGAKNNSAKKMLNVSCRATTFRFVNK